MSFTPGPWRFVPIPSRRAKGFAYYGIAIEGENPRLFGTTDTEANARLIAAAPDLYEACKAALEFLRDDLEDGDPSVDDAAMRELMDVGGLLWIAIQKAGGQ